MGKESLDLSCFNIVGQTIVNSHTEKLEVESAKNIVKSLLKQMSKMLAVIC